MTRDEIRRAIHDTNGKIFTIRFRKKNGELRELNGRIRVHFGQKRDLPTTAHLPQYRVVYDLKSEGWRNVNLDQVEYFKCGDTVLTK